MPVWVSKTKMTTIEKGNDVVLIAPCGVNCMTCRVHLREKNVCPGCRAGNNSKPKHCITCNIKNCEFLKKTVSGFCYDCMYYPCTRLKHLDTRYRLKYGMSILDNLETIKTIGLVKFAANEKVRWTCSSCGGMICVHTGYCVLCKNEIEK